MKSLVEFLAQVPDPRRKQGQRIELPHFLSMVILGNMSGSTGLQSLSRFFKNNENYFIERYGLLHGVPGYTRIRTLLQTLDFHALNDAFKNWSLQYIEPGDWISLDGKGLNSTVDDYSSSYQDFHSIVSAFSDRLGIAVCATTFQNKKKSEIASVRELIETLKQKNVVISLDALHCQKKRHKLSWSQEMIM